MRSISTAERRARLVRRHRLALEARTDDVAEIARSLVVLHATDPATVFLSVAARSAAAKPSEVERALYDDRTLLRMLAMRRTMFVAPVELVPALQSSTANALAAKQRRRYATMIERGSDIRDVPAWFRRVEDATHQALLARGEATGTQLSTDVPELRTQVDPAPGKAYSRPTGVTTWVLVALGCEGLIVRGRPNGGWTSSQYRWAPIETWLPGGIAAVPVDQARTEVVRRWLHAFGPAPVTDLKWWTGWTAAEVGKALALLDTTQVDLDGATGIVLADDLEPTAPTEPAAALLPALDATPMGWQERGWFLSDHGPLLFDRNGNIGPSIWWNGRIIGGWAQRKNGEIAIRLLEDAGTDAEAAIAREAERITAWYGDVRSTPRFRTPLEKELTA